jgi:hypothetical protein
MRETQSQKAIRLAIAADQERRRLGRVIKVSGVPDIPGDDCPTCHGRAGRKACRTCGI